MTPNQKSALESLVGRPLTEPEVAQITPLVASGSTQQIADILSIGRTTVFSRIVTARGLAELIPGGPIEAEKILLKLEATGEVFGASSNPEQKVLGSLIKRQLSFLSGDGLDFGSPALRSMLDFFQGSNLLTAQEVSALKGIAVRPNPLTHTQIVAALLTE